MTDQRPQRTYWKRRIIFDRADGSEREVRDRVEAAHANLVGSLCESGLHAPTFDLDLAASTRQFRSRTRVSIKATGMRLQVSRFLELLHAHRIIDCDPLDSGIPPGLQGDDVDLPELRMAAPHQLLPSSSSGHFHLLVDVEMPWDDYALLLHAAFGAGVIDDKYLNYSLKHKQSFLIKPGLTKSDFAHFYEEIDSRPRRFTSVYDDTPHQPTRQAWRTHY